MSPESAQEDKEKSVQDDKMLKAFEHFLSQEDAQINIIRSLSQDFERFTKNNPTRLIGPSDISFRTLGLVLVSFLKSPKQAYQLYLFASDLKKYNTPEFQDAILKSRPVQNFLNTNLNKDNKIIQLLSSPSQDKELLKVLEIIPILIKDQKTLKEMLDIYYESKRLNEEAENTGVALKAGDINIYHIGPKIFNLIAKDTYLQAYFEKNSEFFEKLIVNKLNADIDASRKSLDAQNNEFKALDATDKRAYILKAFPDIEKNLKSKLESQRYFAEFKIQRMIERGQLEDFGETLEMYGVKKENIAAFSKLIGFSLKSPKYFTDILETYANSNYLGMSEHLFALLSDDSTTKTGITVYLQEHTELIVGILKANVFYTPEFKDLDITALVPALLEHPEEVRNIISNIIAITTKDTQPEQKSPKILELTSQILILAKADPRIAEFLEKNKTLLGDFAIKAAGFEQYAINNEIINVLIPLTTKDNLDRIILIVDLVKKQENLRVAIEVTDLLASDPVLLSSLSKNQVDLNKIAEYILVQLDNKIVSNAFANIDIGAFTSKLINKPQEVHDLLTSFHNASYGKIPMAAARLAQWTLSNSDLQVPQTIAKSVLNTVLPTVLNTVLPKTIAKSVLNNVLPNTKPQQQKQQKKQELVDTIATALDEQSRNGGRLDFSTYRKKICDEAENNTTSPLNKKIISDLNNNNIFKNITIKKPKTGLLNLHNIDITSIEFTNTAFKDVSFSGSKFTNSNFQNATFTNTSFSGATIDKTTLKSLLPAIRAGSINLDNVTIDGATLKSLLPAIRAGSIVLDKVIITGSLDQLDLKDISFNGANLTGVTSMSGANIAGADFTKANMPVNKDTLITQAFNMTSAQLKNTPITKDMMAANRAHLSKEISTKLGQGLTNDQKKQLTTTILTLYNDSSKLGLTFRKAMKQNPTCLYEHDFSAPSTLQIIDVFDDKGTSLNYLKILHKNRNTPKKIEADLTVNIIAEEVATRICKGDIRENDLVLLQELLSSAVTDSDGNINSEKLKKTLKQPVFGEIISKITEGIQGNSNYINFIRLYLSDNLKNDQKTRNDLIAQISFAINSVCEENKLTLEEKDSIKTLSLEITTELFGNVDSVSSAKERQLIQNSLEQTFYTLKEAVPNLEIATMSESERKSLVGTMNHGRMYSTGTGLFKLFYDHTNIGAKSLAQHKIQTPEFQEKLTNKIVTDLGISDKVTLAATKRQATLLGQELKDSQQNGTLLNTNNQRTPNHGQRTPNHGQSI